MDPRTYNALYRPARPASPPRRTPMMVLAVALWLLAATALAGLGFLVGMTALWGAAEGMVMSGLLLRFAAGLGAGAAVLIAVGRAPAVKRMSAEGRSLLLAALACPLALVLVVVLWLHSV
ncbi:MULTISPECIES: hypothetical protein [Streptomyces]|uniref:Uncharacterized protein n=2 Tax=Streptomyces TaxID=1883 RepID=A0A1E7LL76_9ACTN|nr:hypothetical protein [Streptomyces nanshensis]OEV16924.1 hypothetical protein AN221_30080 [Streptomyces nanshensis]